MKSIRTDYKYTLLSCYGGLFSQAVAINFVPLIFIQFSRQFGLSLAQLAVIPALDFIIQLIMDMISPKLLKHISVRAYTVGGASFMALGTGLLGVLPFITGDPYVGILICTVVAAIGSGTMEVIVSPIVEACPTENKASHMSLLHSFYCWGSLFTIILTTVFFNLLTIEKWRVIAGIWAIVPLADALLFAVVPITIVTDEETSSPIGNLVKDMKLWLILIAMFAGGATEHAITNWASAFAEDTLNISKTLGDLIGPCMFALSMGLGRMFNMSFSKKFKILDILTVAVAACAVLLILTGLIPNSYVSIVTLALTGFFVSVLWPGTLSLGAEIFPAAGTSVYALYALFGDIGCTSGSGSTGLVADAFNGNLRAGFIWAAIFPIIGFVALLILRFRESSKSKVAQDNQTEK